MRHQNLKTAISFVELQSISVFVYFVVPSQDAKSHHWKVRFLLLNVCFCAFAGFFYWKHNMYCESGSEYLTHPYVSVWIVCCFININHQHHIYSNANIHNILTKLYFFCTLFLLLSGYTFFALFEYLVVFSNMAFHLTAVWDFKSREVMLISSSEDKDF